MKSTVEIIRQRSDNDVERFTNLETDDLQAIAKLCERHRFWLHVDGAFGAVDGHKWLNVPYDSAVVFTRHLDLQGETYRSAAPHLPTEVRPDTFLHLTPTTYRGTAAARLGHQLAHDEG